MPILIISCSLNPRSRSHVMALEAQRVLGQTGRPADMLDLREVTLPHCDGDSCRSDPQLPGLKQGIAGSEAVILACPIYNYDVNAAAKNLVELTGRDAWTEKIVGFLCAAGGHGSYRSVMGLANSLMLDFRCLVVPRFVYATKDAFADGRITSPAILERVEQLCCATVELADALQEHRRARAGA
jgi:FMN reductase